MTHNVGAGVYLKEVFVSISTKPLLLYYKNIATILQNMKILIC